jgi:pre-rRNA-processing protein TSR4
MAPYDDSDSSGGEEVDYTETNVLLGYASKDADDDTISRLGGRPVSLRPCPRPFRGHVL